MVQPPVFVDRHHPYHVRKLRKELYGLKQAPILGCNASIILFSIMVFQSLMILSIHFPP